MNEQGTNVLEQYDLEVFRTGRGRGAVLCETNDGLKLLKECRAPAGRIEAEARCKEALSDTLRLDGYVRNREGSLISVDEEEIPYTLRNWFDGRECSTREEREMAEAVRLLARFHRAAQTLPEEWTSGLGRAPVLRNVFDRHNRELRRARTYIRNTVQKSEFELCVIRSYERFYAQAERAFFLLQKMEDVPAEHLCHGEFTQHHVLMDRDGAALVDFSRAGLGVQVSDLYLFLRKMMEKNDWSRELGEKLLAAYEEVRPLTKTERRYLYLLFLYPEKYWKQINYYYNANKAWIPGRNIGKLTALEEQFDAREDFLAWLDRETG